MFKLLKSTNDDAFTSSKVVLADLEKNTYQKLSRDSFQISSIITTNHTFDNVRILDFSFDRQDIIVMAEVDTDTNVTKTIIDVDTITIVAPNIF